MPSGHFRPTGACRMTCLKVLFTANPGDLSVFVLIYNVIYSHEYIDDLHALTLFSFHSARSSIVIKNAITFISRDGSDIFFSNPRKVECHEIYF